MKKDFKGRRLAWLEKPAPRSHRLLNESSCAGSQRAPWELMLTENPKATPPTVQAADSPLSSPP